MFTCSCAAVLNVAMLPNDFAAEMLLTHDLVQDKTNRKTV
jgi:hypothetical protein